jgi:SAM-dependent methyltransferase
MDTTTTRQAWRSGIDRELAWWRGYLASGGLSQPEEFRFRFDRDAPLQPHVARVLPPLEDGAGHRILDCAAGPATTLGKTLDGRHLAITAVDALAEPYRALLDELGLVPPMPTLPGEVERLDTLFAADRFDLVYMRFALDHCYDPLAALRQMARVARPGGVVMVEHYRDEAEAAYQGLRQWDLRPEPGDLVVANARDRFRVGEAVPGVRLEVAFSPTWLTVLLRKPPREEGRTAGACA